MRQNNMGNPFACEDAVPPFIQYDPVWGRETEKQRPVKLWHPTNWQAGTVYQVSWKSGVR